MTKAKPHVVSLLGQVARYALIAVFLLSAIGKLISPSQFENFISQLISLSPHATKILLFVLVGLEIGVALLLLYRPFSHVGAIISACFLLAFTLVLMYAMQTEVPSSCGCFGEVVGDSSIDLSILRNLGLLTLSIFVLSSSHSLRGEQQNG